MYFQDRARAISEIARVTRPGGRVAVATWAAVEESPGYAAMVDLLGDEIGDWAAEAMRAPFCIGAAEHLGDLLRTSFPDVAVERHDGQARFASLDEWLHTEIRGLDAGRARRRRTIRPAASTGRRRAGADSSATTAVVRFAAPALIACATAT